MIYEGKLISLQVETPPDSGVYKDLATFDCGADDNASDEYKWSTKDFTIEVESMRFIFRNEIKKMAEEKICSEA